MMSLGAYFSSQGVPFPQAVGGLGRVGMLRAYQDGSLGGVGPLTAFKDGSLGRTGPLRAYQDGSLGAPESTTTRVQGGALTETWDPKNVYGNGNAQMVTVEESTAAPVDQAACMAECAKPVQPMQSLQVKVGPNSSWHDGIFQAEDDPGTGPLQAFQSGSLGMPLYLNGREVTQPLTIHHGPVSGIGGCGSVCGCGGCGGLHGTDTPVDYSKYLLYAGLAALGIGAYFMSRGK